MTKDELRAEEDYFENLGLDICDGCHHGNGRVHDDCGMCCHNYHSMYVPDRIVAIVREAKDGKTV